MHEVIEQFTSPSVLILILVIWPIVWVLRQIIERSFPKVKRAKFWREFVVVVAPWVVGVLIGLFVPAYPWPELFAASEEARAALGLVCGLLTGHVYRLVNKIFVDKIRENRNSKSSDSPPFSE